MSLPYHRDKGEILDPTPRLLDLFEDIRIELDNSRQDAIQEEENRFLASQKDELQKIQTKLLNLQIAHYTMKETFESQIDHLKLNLDYKSRELVRIKNRNQVKAYIVEENERFRIAFELQQAESLKEQAQARMLQKQQQQQQHHHHHQYHRFRQQHIPILNRQEPAINPVPSLPRNSRFGAVSINDLINPTHAAPPASAVPINKLINLDDPLPKKKVAMKGPDIAHGKVYPVANHKKLPSMSIGSPSKVHQISSGRTEIFSIMNKYDPQTPHSICVPLHHSGPGPKSVSQHHSLVHQTNHVPTNSSLVNHNYDHDPLPHSQAPLLTHKKRVPVPVSAPINHQAHFSPISSPYHAKNLSDSAPSLPELGVTTADVSRSSYIGRTGSTSAISKKNSPLSINSLTNPVSVPIVAPISTKASTPKSLIPVSAANKISTKHPLVPVSEMINPPFEVDDPSYAGFLTTVFDSSIGSNSKFGSSKPSASSIARKDAFSIKVSAPKIQPSSGKKVVSTEVISKKKTGFKAAKKVSSAKVTPKESTNSKVGTSEAGSHGKKLVTKEAPSSKVGKFKAGASNVDKVGTTKTGTTKVGVSNPASSTIDTFEDGASGKKVKDGLGSNDGGFKVDRFRVKSNSTVGGCQLDTFKGGGLKVDESNLDSSKVGTCFRTPGSEVSSSKTCSVKMKTKKSTTSEPKTKNSKSSKAIYDKNSTKKVKKLSEKAAGKRKLPPSPVLAPQEPSKPTKRLRVPEIGTSAGTAGGKSKDVLLASVNTDADSDIDDEFVELLLEKMRLQAEIEEAELELSELELIRIPDDLKLAPDFLYSLKEEDADPKFLKKTSDYYVLINPELPKTIDIELVHTFKHESFALCSKFSPDGKYFATASSNITRVYEVSTGKLIAELVDKVKLVPKKDLVDRKRLNLRKLEDEQSLILKNLINEKSLNSKKKLIDKTSLKSKESLIDQKTSNSKKKVTDKKGLEPEKKLVDKKKEKSTSKKSFNSDEDFEGSVEFVNYALALLAKHTGESEKSKKKSVGLESGESKHMSERKIEKQLKKAISSICFSPDGKFLATGSEDKLVRVWDWKAGKVKLRLKGHKLGVTSLDYFPDGRRLVSGSYDRTVKVWDLSNPRKCQLNLFADQEIQTVATSPNGKYVAGGGAGGSVKIWDSVLGFTLDRLEEQTYNKAGHSGPIESLAFINEGKEMVTASSDVSVKLWSVEGIKTTIGRTVPPPKRECKETYIGHDDNVNSIGCSSDSKYLVTGSDDRGIVIWDKETSDVLLMIQGHDLAVQHVDVSELATEEEGYFSSSCVDGIVRVWKWSQI